MQTKAVSTSFSVDISNTLKADFDLLRETQSYGAHSDRRQKFSNKTVDKFARYIVCRNYAGLCFELTHLCWAIVNTGDSKSVFEYFYIHEAVTAQSMRKFFDAIGSDACRLHHASVSMANNDHKLTNNDKSFKSVQICIHQHTFTVHPSRANLLGVCFEWLVTILPNMFERIFDALSGKGFNAIQSMALSLQKEIYDYIAEHLPAAKAQSKFQFLSKWLHQRNISAFTDDEVLSVWQALRGREGTERYTTVVKDVFQFQEALTKAEHQHALHFSEDIDQLYANEPLFEALEMHSMAQVKLHELCDTPKLISKQQAERLQLIGDYPDQCLHFGLSVLRFNVFGPLQAKAIQAQRNKSLCAQTLEVPTENLYADQVQKLKAQLTLNELTFYATLHIILQQDPEQAIELLVANRHAINQFFSELGAELKDDHANQDIDITGMLVEHSTLIDTCKRAYQQTNRQGFTQPTLIADTQIYIERNLALLSLSDTLGKLIQKNLGLFEINAALFEKYQADGYIFSNELLERMLP